MQFARKFALVAAAGVLSAHAAYGQARGDWPGYGLSAGGYGMPAFCQIDHRARGAAIGAAIGEARGGAHGAQIGAAIGAARGEQIDAVCRQIASARAPRPAPEPPSPTTTGMPVRQPRAASGLARPQDGTVPPIAAPARQSPGEYLMRSDHLSQAVAPLTDTVSAPERCVTSLEVSFASQDAPLPSVTGQVCEGLDGRLREKM